MPLEYTPQNRVPLPPTDATVHTTACAYCVVGVHVPVGWD